MKIPNGSTLLREIAILVCFYWIFLYLTFLLDLNNIFVEVFIAVILTTLFRIALYFYERDKNYKKNK